MHGSSATSYLLDVRCPAPYKARCVLESREIGSVGSKRTHNGKEGAQAEGKGDAQVLGLSAGDGLQARDVCGMAVTQAYSSTSSFYST